MEISSTVGAAVARTSDKRADHRPFVATSKLTIPQPVRARVTRPGLVDQIERAPQRLGLVVGPAGCGKTAVLAEWAMTTAAGVAWLSCDHSDSDPSQFWLDVTAAVGFRWPGAGDDAALVLQRDLGAEAHMVASLSQDLADVDGPAAIVIDDVQFAKSAQPTLLSFAQALPAQVRLVLGSRVDPAFSLAKLRLDGALFELRAADLAFSRDEAAALFALAGLSIGESDLDRLHALNEGWPAGLQLAALALRGNGDPRRVIDALASTSRAVNDYLLNEVLERLPGELVEFMGTISVLEEFDASLCQAVTGQPDADRLLAELVSADLFVVAVDPAGGRYRFHHLFAAFLRARLASLGADHLREAQERAIEALEHRGERLSALRLAMVSGNTTRAASIVTATISASLDLSDSQVSILAVRAWLREYGLEAADRHPEQLLQLMLGLAQLGKPEVEGWLDRVEQAHPDPDPFLSAFLHGTWAEYHLARGSQEEALPHNQLASEAAREAGKPHPLFALLPVQRGRGYLMSGDVDGVSAVLESVSRPVGVPIVDEVRLPALGAWVALQRGELRLARRTAGEVVDAARELGAPSHGIGNILATVVGAAIDVEVGNDTSAELGLRVAETAAQLNGKTGLHSLISLSFARLATAKGQEATAASYLTDARFAFPAPSPTVRAAFAVEELRQAIAFAPQRGTQLLSELPDRVETQLLRARLAVSQGQPTVAGELLDNLDGVETTRARVERNVLRALVAFDHDVPAAHSHLRDALMLARPEGFLRTVLEQGSAVARLLESFPPDGQLSPYVGDLLAMADAALAPLRQSTTNGFVEQLSPREITVLRYLPSRLTNHEIAAELFVSLNTVKTHEKSIYRKLAANSRRQAVEIARSSNLI
jgi:LuxR family transcriptional regulator, maltose regulon positive regulatory protein